ncbi:DMT family transporter [Ruegeria sp. R13_0]|uniref:DMT family transporter n=1 Tax=Ruegeria sp. R13_0 TaxID=2821099 RepID=UPI001ADCB49E|nr:DMT family transporter [Ruegeria sp. R13_0]MBO9436990.1 DMT family transporter [Ruegeria sp. R13_0]
MDLKIALLWFAPLLCGALIPIHAGMNAELSRAAGHPLWATMLSFGISFVFLVVALVWLRPTLPSLPSLYAAPPWAWVGGVIGVIYVMATMVLIPRFGAAAFIAAVVAGQMTMALALDQNGLLGNEPRPADFFRISGAVLSIAGVLIMQLGKAP